MDLCDYLADKIQNITRTSEKFRIACSTPGSFTGYVEKKTPFAQTVF